MSLQGKVAAIIGGEGPLGRAVAQKFLAEGIKLAIGWYSPDEWKEAQALIPDSLKEQVMDMQIDATKEEQVQEFIARAKNNFGGIDILLHMAGLFYAGQLLWEMDMATFNHLIDVNLKSAIISCKYGIQAILERGKGRVFLFPPRETLAPKPRFGAYAVSKAGVTTMVQALREELKETGITVNAIMPAVMDTWRTRHMPHAEPDKWVKPEEVADLLCSLCSDESAALSGSVLKVFGKL